MNKELEALLLTAAKCIGYGVRGVSKSRAADWGVPVSEFVQAGATIPGTSAKAKRAGYYCPRSVWRPKHGKSLYLDHSSVYGGYALLVLSEEGSGESHWQGNLSRWSLREMKAYLRGVADGAWHP